MRLKLLVLGLVCLFCIWTTGCDKFGGAVRKFDPPKTSYQEAFFALSDGPMEMRIRGASVTPEFFAAGSEPPVLGRILAKADFARESGRVVVISRSLWAEHFKSDPAVIGHAVTIDGADYKVIGILPDSSKVPPGAGIWIPKI